MTSENCNEYYRHWFAVAATVAGEFRVNNYPKTAEAVDAIIAEQRRLVGMPSDEGEPSA